MKREMGLLYTYLLVDCEEAGYATFDCAGWDVAGLNLISRLWALTGNLVIDLSVDLRGAHMADSPTFPRDSELVVDC